MSKEGSSRIQRARLAFANLRRPWRLHGRRSCVLTTTGVGTIESGCPKTLGVLKTVFVECDGKSS